MTCQHVWTYLGNDDSWKYCRHCRLPWDRFDGNTEKKKHTPGPWKGDRFDGTVKYAVTGSNGELVLAVQHKSFEYGFIGPNAKEDELLVLAAPDLLEALRTLADCFGICKTPEQFVAQIDEHGFMEAARAAIAKAGGK